MLSGGLIQDLFVSSREQVAEDEGDNSTVSQMEHTSSSSSSGYSSKYHRNSKQFYFLTIRQREQVNSKSISMRESIQISI